MIKLLGWLGFLSFSSTMIPFVLRRAGIYGPAARFFSRQHHFLAFVSFAVLTLHGLWALFGRKGWGWGARENIFSGVTAWLLLLVVMLLAVRFAGKKPLHRFHCGLVVLLAALVFFHLF
ncbi:MAG: hypothetical protein ACOY4I_01160 [Bacillota bacterium]